MGSVIRRKKDANESSSTRHERRHLYSRCRSDSRLSPEGYIHENFTMGIKNPSDSDDIILDKELYNLLEVRYGI